MTDLLEHDPQRLCDANCPQVAVVGLQYGRGKLGMCTHHALEADPTKSRWIDIASVTTPDASDTEPCSA